jgi:hypothetical protein
MLSGIRARYQALSMMVSFEQAQLAAISQFLGGFLLPIVTYCKVLLFFVVVVCCLTHP